MAEGMGNIIEVFKAIPAGKRISFLITFSIVIGGFIALLLYTNRPDYQILFSDLDPADASKITEKLKESRVQYQLKDGGKTIMVPDDSVHQLRLDMATEGVLPTGGSVGFEIFDNMTFGTTEFELKLRYQQALQGELARTIETFDAIDQARVHIVTVGDSLFAEEEQPATASVVLRLNGGRQLDQRQLQGIINLVSGSVKGLKPENVSIVDMQGGILTKGHDKNSIGNVSADQFDYQRKLEETYETQIETMLGPVVGTKNVVAKVSVNVDFKRINTSEENYDPDSAVIFSEQRNTEKATEGKGLPQGSPDLLNQGNQSGEEGTSSSSNVLEKENLALNYKINKTERQTIDESGEVKRLSASVIIDGPYEEATDDKGNPTKVFKQRDKKQMTTFENIVKNAIGFNADRGDQVTVSNIAFSMDKLSIEEMPETVSEGWVGYLKKASKPILNVLIVGLFFLVAIKPFKKWLSQTSEYVSVRGGVRAALPSGSGIEREETHSVGELQTRYTEKVKLLEATKENPDVAADIIKTWLNEVS
jgi:flagellar M-ring protein FliF